MTAKPIPEWAMKLEMDHYTMKPGQAFGKSFALARLLVSTREAALREAARAVVEKHRAMGRPVVVAAREYELTILALIDKEPS